GDSGVPAPVAMVRLNLPPWRVMGRICWPIWMRLILMLGPLEMGMQTLRLTLKPCSAFGTPLKGDTLFGQLCWAIRHRFGETQLTKLLQGYTAGQPFVVISDALPSGFLPRPSLPSMYFESIPLTERK